MRSSVDRPGSRAAPTGGRRPRIWGATAPRIGWINGVIRGRISMPSCATRTRWGATRPRFLPAVPAMWNHSETPRRRRLQFDPLEGRQLLNGGDWPAPRGELITHSDVSLFPPAPISGLDQLFGVAVHSVPVGEAGVDGLMVSTGFAGPIAMVGRNPQASGQDPAADPTAAATSNPASSNQSGAARGGIMVFSMMAGSTSPAGAPAAVARQNLATRRLCSRLRNPAHRQ